MGRRDGSKQMSILETPDSGVAILTNWEESKIQHYTKDLTWFCKIITTEAESLWRKHSEYVYAHMRQSAYPYFTKQKIYIEYYKSGKNVHFLLGN